MRPGHLCAGLISVLLACGLALAWAWASETPPEEQPVNLFDFAKFKQTFKKSYADHAHELAAGMYFMSRALRAAASAVSYRWRGDSYYLAVNHMSDLSPGQLEEMDNPLVGEGWQLPETVDLEPLGLVEPLAPGEVVAGDTSLPEFVPEHGENVLAELQSLLAAHTDEPGYRELAELLAESPSPASDRPAATKLAGKPSGERRRKMRTRDSPSAPPTPLQSPLPPRPLPLSKLINSGQGVELAPGARAKVVARVPSDNPNYKPIELATRGLVDQQRPVQWFELQPPPPTDPVKQMANFMGGLGENIRRTLNLGGGPEAEKGKQKKVRFERKPDEVFLDLRDDNCMFLPRAQGRCGSCYAFAGITVMEYLRCRQTGQLVALSEQYMMDCGTAFVESISGCGGGRPTGVATFLRNFGLHLRAQYPYHAQVDQCPYDEGTDLRETGYLRPDDFSRSLMVPMWLWPRALLHGPLLVAIATGRAFKEYGGGVYSGKKCPEKSTHAVLIVGHGREDQREYWLVRNSLGTTWGEAGYMKLDKKADCIHPQLGFAFGLRNLDQRDQVQFSVNALHKKSRLFDKQAKAQQIVSQLRNQARGFGQTAPADP